MKLFSAILIAGATSLVGIAVAQETETSEFNLPSQSTPKLESKGEGVLQHSAVGRYEVDNTYIYEDADFGTFKITLGHTDTKTVYAFSINQTEIIQSFAPLGEDRVFEVYSGDINVVAELDEFSEEETDSTRERVRLVHEALKQALDERDLALLDRFREHYYSDNFGSRTEKGATAQKDALGLGWSIDEQCAVNAFFGPQTYNLGAPIFTMQTAADVLICFNSVRTGSVLIGALRVGPISACTEIAFVIGKPVVEAVRTASGCIIPPPETESDYPIPGFDVFAFFLAFGGCTLDFDGTSLPQFACGRDSIEPNL